MKRGLKILTTILITFCIIALANNVLAIDVDKYRPGDLKIEDSSPYYTIAGTVISTIRVIAAIVCVAVIVIVGIKIIYGSVEEKAEYKKRFVPIIIGAVFVVGTTTMLKTLEYNLNYDEHKKEEDKAARKEAEETVDSYLEMTLADIDFTKAQDDANYLKELAGEIRNYADSLDETLHTTGITRLKNMARSIEKIQQYYNEEKTLKTKTLLNTYSVKLNPDIYGSYISTDLINGVNDIEKLLEERTDLLETEIRAIEKGLTKDYYSKYYDANLYSPEKIGMLCCLFEEYLTILDYLGYEEGDGFRRGGKIDLENGLEINLREKYNEYVKIGATLHNNDKKENIDQLKEFYNNNNIDALKTIEDKYLQSIDGKNMPQYSGDELFIYRHDIMYYFLAKNMRVALENGETDIELQDFINEVMYP